MTEPVDTAPDMADLVGAAARSTAKKYWRWVELEDVHQELWAHAYGAGRYQYAGWIEKGEAFRVGLDLVQAGREYALNEKAIKSGYRLEDVAWYEPGNVGMLIELALDEEFDGTVAGGGGGGGKKTDPAEGGSLMAMVLDVRMALQRLGIEPQVNEFDPDSEIGRVLCVRVADALGGEFPDSPSYQRGKRHAISNARANVLIRSTETGDH